MNMRSIKTTRVIVMYHVYHVSMLFNQVFLTSTFYFERSTKTDGNGGHQYFHFIALNFPSKNSLFRFFQVFSFKFCLTRLIIITIIIIVIVMLLLLLLKLKPSHISLFENVL